MVSFRRMKSPLVDNPIKVYEAEHHSRPSPTAPEGIEVFKRSVLRQNTLQQTTSSSEHGDTLQIHDPTNRHDSTSKEKDIEVIHRQITLQRNTDASPTTTVKVVNPGTALSLNAPIEERTFVSHKKQDKKKLLRALICRRPSDIESSELDKELWEGTIASILEDDDDDEEEEVEGSMGLTEHLDEGSKGRTEHLDEGSIGRTEHLDEGSMGHTEHLNEDGQQRQLNLQVLHTLMKEKKSLEQSRQEEKEEIQNVQQEARNIEQANLILQKEQEQAKSLTLQKEASPESDNVPDDSNETKTVDSVLADDVVDKKEEDQTSPDDSPAAVTSIHQGNSCMWDCGASDASSTVISGCSSIASLDLSLDFLLDELGCALKDSFFQESFSLETAECYGCATAQAAILEDHEDAFNRPTAAPAIEA